MDKVKAGKMIRQARQWMGITQHELAAMLNVTQGTVASWEIGTAFPRPRSMVKLCEVLKIPVENLLKAG